MRTSANLIKGNVQGARKQAKPREGTELRIAYDRALTGLPFKINDLKRDRISLMRQLKDYNLELVSQRDPANPKGAHFFRCVGVWDSDTLRTMEDVQIALENSLVNDMKQILQDVIIGTNEETVPSS